MNGERNRGQLGIRGRLGLQPEALRISLSGDTCFSNEWRYLPMHRYIGDPGNPLRKDAGYGR